MARERFNTDPLVQIPAGALAALHAIAQTFVDGMGGEGESIVNDALKEVAKCALAQGVSLEAALPEGYYDEGE